MTIQEAREIIGDESVDLSDDEIQSLVNSAELLKEIFFDQLRSTYE